MAVTPKWKEGTYWTHKEGKALGGSDQKCFDYHVFYVCYHVTNIICSAIKKAVNWVWGLAPRNISTMVYHTMPENAPLQTLFN